VRDDDGIEEEPAGFQRELARLLLSEESVSGLLDILLKISISAVPGVQGASISQVLGDSERLETSNASSPEIRFVDEGQYQDGDGPCVEAIRSGHEVRVSLPMDRSPTFAARARRAGVSSVLSLPLQVQTRTTGDLNLYSIGGAAVSEAGSQMARALAEQAAMVLANAGALASAELAKQHLEEALNTRDLIGQAKGILMARQGVTAQEAFDVLRRASQRSGRKLRDIAVEVASNPGSAPRDGR
jgi:transcriptional regulator with GAF, ATPase, and Fis domain